MTAEEVYESVTNGGTSDFAAAAEILDRTGAWCLIGGLAVNCYAEPVYTVDADCVVLAEAGDGLKSALSDVGFTVRTFTPSINARRSGSKLHLQVSTGPRHQEFLTRAERREVLGRTIPVASLGDVIRGKVWAWQDRERRLTKRKKDELDLLRLAEAHPDLRSLFPPEIVNQLETDDR